MQRISRNRATVDKDLRGPLEGLGRLSYACLFPRLYIRVTVSSASVIGTATSHKVLWQKKVMPCPHRVCFTTDEQKRRTKELRVCALCNAGRL